MHHFCPGPPPTAPHTTAEGSLKLDLGLYDSQASYTHLCPAHQPRSFKPAAGPLPTATTVLGVNSLSKPAPSATTSQGRRLGPACAPAGPHTNLCCSVIPFSFFLSLNSPSPPLLHPPSRLHQGRTSAGSRGPSPLGPGHPHTAPPPLCLPSPTPLPRGGAGRGRRGAAKSLRLRLPGSPPGGTRCRLALPFTRTSAR